MRKSRFTFLLAALVGLALLGGSDAWAQEAEDEAGGYSVDAAAIVPLVDAEGNQVGLVAVGTADDEAGLMVIAQGLTPGEHGVHLHAVGNCDPAGEKTFEKAGGHFNPEDLEHPNHAGDLGNLTANENGVIFLGGFDKMTFDDAEFGLADADGTALVIHETADDLVTDPAGNSGARIACAVLFAPAA